MAQEVTVTLIDDLEGGAAAETVPFALDGKSYEIDLSAKNARALRSALKKYIEVARRGSAPRRAGGKGAARDYSIVDLREWAAKHKIEVPARGRIPGEIVDRYKAAGGK